MRGLCCVEQSFLHITKLSPLKPKPPFLHPKTKWNIQAKAKGFSGASNKNIVQAKKGMPKEPENGNGKDYDDDDKIPQVVTDRMIKRILFYVGVPLVTGVIILRGFDVVKEQNVVDVPKWLPFLTTFITFGTSALGIAIGTLSASWDAGSKFKKLPLTKILSSQTPSPPSSDKAFDIVSILLAIPNWADKNQERRMKTKRLLYKPEDWVQHRSSLRHIRHLLSSLNSRVVLSLVPPVIAFTSVAIVVATYNSAVLLHWLPEFFPVLRASSLPYQLTAPALALLLVFRTEASYSRYEEGRKAWTKVISGTNDFARQVISSVDLSSDVLVKNALLQYIMAFPVALKCHVIHGSDIAQDLQTLIEPEDLSVIVSSTHRPRCIIDFISQTLRMLNLEESKLNVLESKISCFYEGIGICEQLIGIPIPLSYTRLTSRFLVLWHFSLPIILWDDCNWIVVPATFISAASLFCIEEVGVLIEEPFPMLPLDELLKLLQNNIQEAMENELMIRQLITKRKNRSRKPSPNGQPTT